MKKLVITAIAILALPTSVNAGEFKGLVNVNPINNYHKNFKKSFNRVLAATNYIDAEDDRYEDAIMRSLATIQVDGCMAKKIDRPSRKSCVARLEKLGNSLENYLGL